MAQSDLEKKAISSSSGEEEQEESSESESEPEIQPQQYAIKPQKSSEEEEDEEEDDSDSDSPPKHSKKPDPLPSNPIDDESHKKPKNPNLKLVTGKRKSTEEVANESKIPKKNEAVSTEKKLLFQRLWSEDDEIQLIKGLINYVETKGKDATSDISDFHEFVKTSLNIDVNNAQMSAKIKRLKGKFMNNRSKIEQKGKVRSLSNPHEKKMYELSEKVWGDQESKRIPKKVIVKPTINHKGKKSNSVNNGGIRIKASGGVKNGVIKIPVSDDDIMNQGLELASGSKKVELQKKWEELKIQEFKHFLKKMELMQEQAELVLSVLAKTGAS